MNGDDELRHLIWGPAPNERPEGLGLERVEVDCDGNAGLILARATDVLLLVLNRARGEWPLDEQWADILPRWFAASFSLSGSPKAFDEWELLPWIYWFDPHDERSWRWWNATIVDRDKLHIEVEVSDYPVPLGELDWLLKRAGAADVRRR